MPGRRDEFTNFMFLEKAQQAGGEGAAENWRLFPQVRLAPHAAPPGRPSLGTQLTIQRVHARRSFGTRTSPAAITTTRWGTPQKAQHAQHAQQAQKAKWAQRVEHASRHRRIVAARRSALIMPPHLAGTAPSPAPTLRRRWTGCTMCHRSTSTSPAAATAASGAHRSSCPPDAARGLGCAWLLCPA